jgi:DNA sulfur modification protein DndD
MPKLASVIREEVELILTEKESVASAKGNILNDEQIEKITRDIVKIIEERYVTLNKIDVKAVADQIREAQEKGDDVQDRYSFLNAVDVDTLKQVVRQSYVNSFLALSEQRERLVVELADMPHRQEQLEDYQRMLSGSDYTIIELYERNNKRIEELRSLMEMQKQEIKKLTDKISRYDYDMPQIPDPQYDMLCKLPEFFKALSSKLLAAKKASIERMMKDQLNLNLVVYAGCIGRVELSADTSDDINFKIFHKEGNEIFLSQLNAGAKQTVMQVLLKVLYELGDYDPPVMIDTVMGVLDKASREVILQEYFPDLAQQTILLSTDTEITTENDFKKIQAKVAKTYTLHRDKEKQCTTVSDDYFGLKTYEEY